MSRPRSRGHWRLDRCRLWPLAFSHGSLSLHFLLQPKSCHRFLSTFFSFFDPDPWEGAALLYLPLAEITEIPTNCAGWIGLESSVAALKKLDGDADGEAPVYSVLFRIVLHQVSRLVFQAVPERQYHSDFSLSPITQMFRAGAWLACRSGVCSRGWTSIQKSCSKISLLVPLC